MRDAFVPRLDRPATGTCLTGKCPAASPVRQRTAGAISYTNPLIPSNGVLDSGTRKPRLPPDSPTPKLLSSRPFALVGLAPGPSPPDRMPSPSTTPLSCMSRSIRGIPRNLKQITAEPLDLKVALARRFHSPGTCFGQSKFQPVTPFEIIDSRYTGCPRWRFLRRALRAPVDGTQRSKSTSFSILRCLSRERYFGGIRQVRIYERIRFHGSPRQTGRPNLR